MAIIIPSKRIYEIQNPKVIENALKRIDVEQYKTEIINTNQDTDHLESIIQNGTVADPQISETYNRIFPTTGTEYMFSAGLKTESTSYFKSLELPRFQNNYYIREVAPQIEVDYTVTISTIPAISYIGQIPSGKKRFDFSVSNSIYHTQQTNSKNLVFSTLITNYDYKNSYKLEDVISILSDKIYADFSVTDYNQEENGTLRLASKITLTRVADSVNPSYPYSFEISETLERFQFNINFINKLTVWFAQDHALASLKDASLGRPIEATKIEFVATKAKIVYNETVRHLSYEEVSTTIENSNSNGEETFSITENPFIRTDNKYLSNQNATVTLYENTLNKYVNGKETAKILCSIGEYLDENGNLVISTKTDTKMLFEHYDKVVPLVKVGKRQELAMSYTADGLAKVFDVVGVRVFFDGAVWQELTLRESGEGIDIGRTTYTTIPNKASGLTYKITSNEIFTEENSASGITYIIGD